MRASATHPKFRAVDALSAFARSVPTTPRAAGSFVAEVRRALDPAPVRPRPLPAMSEAPTRELPRVRLAAPPVHVRAPGVEPRLLVAARLVSHLERRALDAIAEARDTATFAASLGIGLLAAEHLLARLVGRGLATRHEAM